MTPAGLAFDGIAANPITSDSALRGSHGDERASSSSHRLALGAVAGPVVFTLGWFVLGFLSPGYTLFGTRIAPYSAVS